MVALLVAVSLGAKGAHTAARCGMWAAAVEVAAAAAQQQVLHQSHTLFVEQHPHRMRSSQSWSWYLLHPVVMLVHAKFHSASAAASWPCMGETHAAKCAQAGRQLAAALSGCKSDGIDGTQAGQRQFPGFRCTPSAAQPCTPTPHLPPVQRRQGGPHVNRSRCLPASANIQISWLSR